MKQNNDTKYYTKHTETNFIYYLTWQGRTVNNKCFGEKIIPNILLDLECCVLHPFVSTGYIMDLYQSFPPPGNVKVSSFECELCCANRSNLNSKLWFPRGRNAKFAARFLTGGEIYHFNFPVSAWLMENEIKSRMVFLISQFSIKENGTLHRLNIFFIKSGVSERKYQMSQTVRQ